MPPGRVGAIGSVIHFDPEGLTFNAAVTFKIPYTEEDQAAAGGADPAALDVYAFNSATELWESVGQVAPQALPDKQKFSA